MQGDRGESHLQDDLGLSEIIQGTKPVTLGKNVKIIIELARRTRHIISRAFSDQTHFEPTLLILGQATNTQGSERKNREELLLILEELAKHDASSKYIVLIDGNESQERDCLELHDPLKRFEGNFKEILYNDSLDLIAEELEITDIRDIEEEQRRKEMREVYYKRLRKRIIPTVVERIRKNNNVIQRLSLLPLLEGKFVETMEKEKISYIVILPHSLHSTLFIGQDQYTHLRKSFEKMTF